MATIMKKSELQRILKEIQQIKESRIAFEKALKEKFGKESGEDLFTQFYYHDVYKFYKELNEYLELVKFDASSIEEIFPIPKGYLEDELQKAFNSGVSAIPTVANYINKHPEKYEKVPNVADKPSTFIDDRIELLSDLEDINLATLKKIVYRELNLDGNDVEKMNYKPNRLFAIKFLEGMKQGIEKFNKNFGIKVGGSKIDFDDDTIRKVINVALNNWFALMISPYKLIVDFISTEYMEIHKQINSILTTGFSVALNNNLDAYMPVVNELSKIQMIARGENSLVDKLIAKQNLSFNNVIDTVNTAATAGIDQNLFTKQYI